MLRRIALFVIAVTLVTCACSEDKQNQFRAADDARPSADRASAAERTKAAEQSHAMASMTAEIASARFEESTQTLTMQVSFSTSGRQLVLLVAPDFTFLNDPDRDGEPLDVRRADRALEIDLSRRLGGIQKGGSTEGPRSLPLTQTVPILDPQLRPFSGVKMVTYSFRFPLNYRAVRNRAVQVCDKPHRTAAVSLVFGYGVESPITFERTFPKRDEPWSLDKALNETWQRQARTAAVMVDFGGTND